MRGVVAGTAAGLNVGRGHPWATSGTRQPIRFACPGAGYLRLVGVAIKCTQCGATSVSSLFYLGPDAHVCRICSAPFDLIAPARARRQGLDRRSGNSDADWAEWRSGDDRRRTGVLV